MENFTPMYRTDAPAKCCRVHWGPSLSLKIHLATKPLKVSTWGVSTWNGGSPVAADKTDSTLLSQCFSYFEVLSMVYRKIIFFHFPNPHWSTRRMLLAQGHLVSDRSMTWRENTDRRANVVIDFWGCDYLSCAYNNTFKEENSWFTSKFYFRSYLILFFSNLMYQRILAMNACLIGTLRNHIFSSKEKVRKRKKKWVRHCKLRIQCVNVSDYLRENTMHLLYDIKENELKLNASTNTVVQL